MSKREFLAQQLVKNSLRLSFKLPSAWPLPVPWLRRGMEAGAKLFTLHPRAVVESVVLAGVSCDKVSVDTHAQKAVLHFHGGAFFSGSAKTHRALASELSAHSGASVYVVDYRLAPEHPYPAAIDDGVAAYRALLAQGYLAKNIVLGGDSGGCAHILNLAIRLRDDGIDLPAGMLMISPFVDLTLSAPSVTHCERRDPMVTAYALRRGADGYRGTIAANDPRVSPLFADLQGLPPTLIQVGANEILLDDAISLRERGLSAGMTIACQVYDGMWHNFQMFSNLLKTSEQALEQLGAFIKTGEVLA